MRQIIIITMLTVAPLSATAEPYEATRSFRSTLLGFSFEYPADWQKHPVYSSYCVVVSREESLRRLDGVANIAGGEWDPFTSFSHPWISVSRQRVLDESFAEYIKTVRKHQSETIGNSTTTVTYTTPHFEGCPDCSILKVDAGATPDTNYHFGYIEYHFVTNNSLFVVRCEYNAPNRLYLKQTFDRIAQSFEIFTPNHDPECDGYKTASLNGASFEYPTTLTRRFSVADDHDAKGILIERRVEPPDHGAYLKLSFKNETLDEYDALARNMAEHPSITSFDIGRFTTTADTEGLRISTMFVPANHPSKPYRNRFTAIPCSDGRLAILFYHYGEDDPDEVKEGFRHAAKTFTCN